MILKRQDYILCFTTQSLGLFIDSLYFCAFCVTYSYDEATGTMDPGFPKSVEDDFPGMHDEFDAVTFHQGNMQNSVFSPVNNPMCNTYW